MKATHALAFISLQLSGKENLLFFSPHRCPWGFFLSLSLPFFSQSLLIQAQKTNKQNSSPFLTPCTGSPLFHFLSCQPELPSYSLTCPISLFPSSPALPLHLPLDTLFYFSLSRCCYLFFSFGSRRRTRQPALSAVIKAPRHGSGLYHPLNSSFLSCDMISCSTACCRRVKAQLLKRRRWAFFFLLTSVSLKRKASFAYLKG